MVLIDVNCDCSVSHVSSITSGCAVTAAATRPLATVKPPPASQSNVKQPLVSNVKQSDVVKSDMKLGQKTEEASKPLSAQATVSVTRARSISSDKPALPTSKRALVSHGRRSNQQRRSVTSQFLKSAADRRRTVAEAQNAPHPVTALHHSIPNSITAQAQSSGSNATVGSKPLKRASDGSKAYHLAQPKTGRQVIMGAKVSAPASQSCRDRRKSYQAQLIIRQKAASKPVMLHHRNSTAAAGVNKQLQTSARVNRQLHASASVNKSSQRSAGFNKQSQLSAVVNKQLRTSESIDMQSQASSELVSGFRVSTPHSSRHRRTTATLTPALSCIPRRKISGTASFVSPRHKTVSFVTPALQRKFTPLLHRTQPVCKEMSMRYSCLSTFFPYT